MSRSQRASRYLPPRGFVLQASRRPEVEVYAPAGPMERRLCAGCTAQRTQDPCVRCGEEGLLQPIRLLATIDEEEALERMRAWLMQAVCPPAAALQASLNKLEVPCDQDGRVLGVLPLKQLTPYEGGQPTEQVPDLDRDPAPLERLVVLPVWVGSFEWEGRPAQVVVDAVGGSVTGDRPVDFARLRRKALFGMLPGLLLGLCMGLPTLLLAGFGVLVWGLALLALLLAHRRWAWMERTALDNQRW